MDYEKFADIRPLTPSEVPVAIAELLQNPALKASYEALGMPLGWEDLGKHLEGCDSVDEFKKRLSYHIVKHVMRHTCTQVQLTGTERLRPDVGYTYISNHRDIILDSAFLNVLLYDEGLKFPQVAIGDNLMLAPWVELLARLNGNFLVRRSLQGREVLLAAKKLSEYMHTATREGISTWIAQREGRAKDSSDHTQPALLKMLALGSGVRSVLEALSLLNIVPVCCSYEYDPCDYLKAREMQLKRDTDYVKTKEEDGLNMYTGVFGQKGQVHLHVARPISEALAQEDWDAIPEVERIERIAAIIDREIHTGYRLYPSNYIAHNLLSGDSLGDYTPEQEAVFLAYLERQIERISIPEGITKDVPYLRERILEMYANPLRNYMRAVTHLSN